MNVLINKKKDKLKNIIFIEESKKSLKFNIIFEEEENEEDEEFKKIEEEMVKLNINIKNKENEDKKDEEEKEDNSENEINEKECIIQVKLFKLQNEYLLRFLKKSGELANYYNNL